MAFYIDEQLPDFLITSGGEIARRSKIALLTFKWMVIKESDIFHKGFLPLF